VGNFTKNKIGSTDIPKTIDPETEAHSSEEILPISEDLGEGSTNNSPINSMEVSQP
jgi:hypothetical protein